MSIVAPEILPLGLDGILVRFSDRLNEPANRAALAFRAFIERDQPEGVTESATSLTSVLIRFQPDVVGRAKLLDRLSENLAKRDWFEASLPAHRKRWCIPTVFGGDHGPQLEEAAELAGLDPQQAIDEICRTDLRVLAVGFAPGQPYLGFLDEHWNIPRQTEVTPEVPQGAVVLAVRQVIPFANAAPTGWRQIGRTAFRCYAANREPALPLSSGDLVRFTQIDEDTFASLRQSTDAMGGASGEALA